MTIKFCKKCNCDTERNKNGSCKVCKRIRGNAHYSQNRDSILRRSSAYKKANPEKLSLQRAAYRAANPDKAKEWRSENPDRAKANRKSWANRNPDKIAISRAKYLFTHKEEISAKQAEYSANNKARIASSHAEYYLINRDAVLERNAEWRSANPEKVAAIGRRFAKRHPHIFCAKSAERRATKLKATPAWVDKVKIDEIYKEASRIQKETGIEMSVDHIVPLISPLVCGFHCEANLQILTKSENSRKSNYWWPDMP